MQETHMNGLVRVFIGYIEVVHTKYIFRKNITLLIKGYS